MLERLEHIETESLDVAGIPTGPGRSGPQTRRHPTITLVVASRSGMGTSAQAMNIASPMAICQGPVACFSLEVSPTEVAYRWLAVQA